MGEGCEIKNFVGFLLMKISWFNQKVKWPNIGEQCKSMRTFPSSSEEISQYTL